MNNNNNNKDETFIKSINTFRTYCVVGVIRYVYCTWYLEERN